MRERERVRHQIRPINSPHAANRGALPSIYCATVCLAIVRCPVHCADLPPGHVKTDPPGPISRGARAVILSPAHPIRQERSAQRSAQRSALRTPLSAPVPSHSPPSPAYRAQPAPPNGPIAAAPHKRNHRDPNPLGQARSDIIVRRICTRAPHHAPQWPLGIPHRHIHAPGPHRVGPDELVLRSCLRSARVPRTCLCIGETHLCGTAVRCVRIGLAIGPVGLGRWPWGVGPWPLAPGRGTNGRAP